MSQGRGGTSRNQPAKSGRYSPSKGRSSTARSTDPRYMNLSVSDLARAEHMRDKERAPDGALRAARRMVLRLNSPNSGGVLRTKVVLYMSNSEYDKWQSFSQDEFILGNKNDGWLTVRSKADGALFLRLPADILGVEREDAEAAFLDKTRPHPTPEMAKRLPVAWRTTISEALENKYNLARWAGMPQGIMTFDLLTDAIGPGAVRQGPSEERSRIARLLFQATCLEAPLYLLTEQTTQAVLAAAEVLEDWTPTADLIPHQNGLVIMFERGITVATSRVGKFTGAEAWDDGQHPTSELRGMVICNIYFGSYDKVFDDPTKVVADEVVFHPSGFSKRVNNWTQRIHLSGLMGQPGISLPMPHDLAGWNIDLPLSQHRKQFDGYEGMEGLAWRTEDEMESKLLGAILLWIKQRIIVHTTRKADRSARKRIEAMQPVGKWKPDAEAEIMLIELRARDYVYNKGDDDGEHDARDYQCRWIVRPHWHKYRCGVGRTIIQSKYLEAYIKGPEGKPLKQPKPIVFAVTR